MGDAEGGEALLRGKSLFCDVGGTRPPRLALGETGKGIQSLAAAGCPLPYRFCIGLLLIQETNISDDLLWAGFKSPMIAALHSCLASLRTSYGRHWPGARWGPISSPGPSQGMA
jgi:hypothetical protein